MKAFFLKYTTKKTVNTAFDLAIDVYIFYYIATSAMFIINQFRYVSFVQINIFLFFYYLSIIIFGFFITFIKKDYRLIIIYILYIQMLY